jgi:ABC-type dipeptide/oligopeptide/nickel transport system permease subunit
MFEGILITSILCIIGGLVAGWAGFFGQEEVSFMAPPILRSQTLCTLIFFIFNFGPAVASLFLVAWWTAPIAWLFTALFVNIKTKQLRKEFHLS